jgi:hypothetical protein
VISRDYTVSRAAGALGIRNETVRHLIRLGWLKADPHPKGWTRISESSLQQYQGEAKMRMQAQIEDISEPIDRVIDRLLNDVWNDRFQRFFMEADVAAALWSYLWDGLASTKTEVHTELSVAGLTADEVRRQGRGGQYPPDTRRQRYPSHRRPLAGTEAYTSAFQCRSEALQLPSILKHV